MEAGTVTDEDAGISEMPLMIVVELAAPNTSCTPPLMVSLVAVPPAKSSCRPSMPTVVALSKPELKTFCWPPEMIVPEIATPPDDKV